MNRISLCIDLVFCGIVLPVMIMIFPIERWFHNFQWYVVSLCLWLYCLYVMNRLVTVPFLFRNRCKIVAGVALIAVSIVVTYGFSRITLYTPKPNVHDIGIDRLLPNILQYQQAVWSLFMIVETFSFAVGLLTQVNSQRARRRAVEAERDKAIIQLYRTQIKPHFMFNTLNSLYGLFLTHDEKALTSLEKYISMMRYIHFTSMCDLVPLSDEADYIGQYVELQRLRLNEMTMVSLDVLVEDASLMVPPMLLVTFVENCFKHGVSSVEKSDITMSLHQHDGVLEFMTCNRIFPVGRIGEHMGIDNCRKRLELLFPGRHKLDIHADGSYFHVKLTISLTI